MIASKEIKTSKYLVKEVKVNYKKKSLRSLKDDIKKEKVEEFKLPNLKIYYKATIFKTNKVLA